MQGGQSRTQSVNSPLGGFLRRQRLHSASSWVCCCSRNPISSGCLRSGLIRQLSAQIASEVAAAVVSVACAEVGRKVTCWDKGIGELG